jgi:hypothetical protein
MLSGCRQDLQHTNIDEEVMRALLHHHQYNSGVSISGTGISATGSQG